MADILASIKRIVAEEDRQGRQSTPFADDGRSVFELTPDMRIDVETAKQNGLSVEMPESVTPSIDETAVADIARVVLREELNGQLGISLTRNIKSLIREEVARALNDRQG